MIRIIRKNWTICYRDFRYNSKYSFEISSLYVMGSALPFLFN
jgi:hypothetical protein